MMKKVFLSLMVALTAAFLFTSCASKTEILKKGVEQAKKEAGLPVTANGITTKDMFYDEATNSVNYLAEMPAEMFGNFAFMAAQPVYQEMFLYSQKDDPAMKNFAKLLLDVNGTLRFTYEVIGGGSNPVVFTFGGETLKQLVDGTLPQPDQSKLQQPAPQQPEGEAEGGEQMGEGEGEEMAEE